MCVVCVLIKAREREERRENTRAEKPSLLLPLSLSFVRSLLLLLLLLLDAFLSRFLVF